MSDFKLKTPVAFMIFKRPSATKRVFEAVRQAKPPKLLVVADGARLDRAEEAEQCAATRAIIDGVDWDCEVLTNYAEVNMGMKPRVVSGLNWVFETVEEAIILEDDCLPDPTFFRFCDELLEKYRDDDRVAMISGTNFFQEWKYNTQSYSFINYGSIWGWASWRRAWQNYDPDLKYWSQPEAKKIIQETIGDRKQYQTISQNFELTYSGKIQTWDYQWDFARWINAGLSIVPGKNLISNLGYGEGAENTFFDCKNVANLPVEPISFPLCHPDEVTVDRAYDRHYYEKILKYNWQEIIQIKIACQIRKLKQTSLALSKNFKFAK